MLMRLNVALPILAGALLLNLMQMETACAALIRRAFSLSAGTPHVGEGYFDYDATALQFDINGNKYTDVLNIEFTYTGQSNPATIDDPLKRVNFDSTDNFLGLDLLLPDPFGLSDGVLIANEDAYIPSTSSTVLNSVVTYGEPTAVPTPALVPGLLVFSWSVLRRKREAGEDS